MIVSFSYGFSDVSILDSLDESLFLSADWCLQIC